mgnify:CR=1 FL=1
MQICPPNVVFVLLFLHYSIVTIECMLVAFIYYARSLKLWKECTERF